MSPVLFDLYIEHLCRGILNASSITEPQITREEVKVLAYADDIVIICASNDQEMTALSLVIDFCDLSG